MSLQYLRIRRYRIEALQDYQVESDVRLNQSQLRVQQLEKQATRFRRQEQAMRAHLQEEHAEADDEASKSAGRRQSSVWGDMSAERGVAV